MYCLLCIVYFSCLLCENVSIVGQILKQNPFPTGLDTASDVEFYHSCLSRSNSFKVHSY